MKYIMEKLTKWEMYRNQLSLKERSTDILHRLEPSLLENANKTEMKLSIITAFLQIGIISGQ